MLSSPTKVRFWKGLPDAGAEFIQVTAMLSMVPAPRLPLMVSNKSVRTFPPRARQTITF